jgi:hypothetical protein
MTAEEWDAWSAMNERLYGFNHADSPCRDCLAVFRREMLAKERCDGEMLPQPLPRGGRPLISPPLPDWRPFRGNPRYATEADRQAARHESSRRSHAYLAVSRRIASCLA